MSEKLKKLIKSALAVVIIAGALTAAYFSGSDVTSDKTPETTQTTTVTLTAVVTSIPLTEQTVPESVTAPPDTSAVTEAPSETSVPTETAPPETQTSVSEQKATQTETVTRTETVTTTEKVTEPPVKAETCTFMISCATVFDNLDKLRAGVIDVIPKDGIIFPRSEVEIREGETVFDLISEICRKNGIPMESSNIAMTNNRYIEGIANLYEFDAGNLSGWMYSVNGKFPQLSTSQVTVKSGDVIEVVYSCNIGVDVGDDYFTKAG